jgi:hypothetical protein
MYLKGCQRRKNGCMWNKYCILAGGRKRGVYCFQAKMLCVSFLAWSIVVIYMKMCLYGTMYYDIHTH